MKDFSTQQTPETPESSLIALLILVEKRAGASDWLSDVQPGEDIFKVMILELQRPFCLSSLWLTVHLRSPILIRRERCVCACREVKLNRMGQAVQTEYFPPKRLELPPKVEPGVTLLAPSTC